MTRSFSVEKWPAGYAFASRRSGYYGRLSVKLLGWLRWLLLACNLVAPIRAGGVLLWLTVAVFAVVEVFRRVHIIDERLIMLKGYGLQVESRSALGRRSVRSLPIFNVERLLINEAICMNEVVFYIVIKLRDSDELVLPFENAIPRLKDIEVIYRTFHEVFPPQKRSQR